MATLRVGRDFGLFALFMALGLILANPLLSLLALAPLFLLFLSQTHESPRGSSMYGPQDRALKFVGDEHEVRSETWIAEGVGLVVVGEPLPDHLRLLAGSNIRVFWKGPGLSRFSNSYTIECTRRGGHTLGAGVVEGIHPCGTRPTTIERHPGNQELAIRHELVGLSRARLPRTPSRIPMPIGAYSRLGGLTTDFREIREYRQGDQYRHVNWKATLRLHGDLKRPPLVNDFEKEGKRTVWLFLDTSQGMATGTNVENAFEHALKATHSLAQIYLGWSCRVGLSLWGQGRWVLPDSSRRQRWIVSKALQGAEMVNTPRTLTQEVKGLRGHLRWERPLVVLLTSVHMGNFRDIAAGLSEIVRSCGGGTRMLVIDVDAGDLASGTDLEQKLRRLNRAYRGRMHEELRATGTQVAVWDIGKVDLEHLIAYGLSGGER